MQRKFPPLQSTLEGAANTPPGSTPKKEGDQKGIDARAAKTQATADTAISAATGSL